MLGKDLHSFACRYPVFPAWFVEKTVLSPLNHFGAVVVIWSYPWGFISGLSTLFHWSICLSLCQYHPLLITKPLSQVSNSGSLSPPVLFFFFQDFFGHLGSHEIMMAFSMSSKASFGIWFGLYEICRLLWLVLTS